MAAVISTTAPGSSEARGCIPVELTWTVACHCAKLFMSLKPTQVFNMTTQGLIWAQGTLAGEQHCRCQEVFPTESFSR